MAHRPKPKAQEPPALPPAAPGDPELRAKILVVDDDERNAFAATSALEDLGHEVVVARSGEEALRRLLVEDFAVILLDLHMPGMDGYETAAFIRQRKRSVHTPIVFLTAVFRDEAHLFQAYTAGAVDVVFKPIDPFILRSKVQVLVDLHLKTLELQRQAEHQKQLLEENTRVQREKLQAEQALRRSQERHQTILASLPIVVCSRRPEPPYAALFVSENVEAVTGFPASAFTSDPAFGRSRIHPEDKEVIDRAMAEAVRSGTYACEFRWLAADGEYRRLLDQGAYAPGPDGSSGEIVGAMLDVTERRSLEEQLAQSRKMETVGQLTGGVAHDFNNLLTVIIGNLDLLSRRTSADERLARNLDAMRYAAERGRSLTRQLLAFSRRQHLSPVALDVNELIVNFAPLLKQAIGEAIELKLDLSSDRLCAEVDPAHLETALLNLAVNARDAMPDGGALSLATRLEPGAKGEPAWIAVQVSDTGVGIPAEAIERIFEPFFTTKEVGKGSGLGLSQVYGFVQQSGGQISVQSRPGEGASFRLRLRTSEKAVEAGEGVKSSACAEIREGHGRVLVVEDDQQVLAVTVEVLSGLGYDVSTACNAGAALERLNAEPVDLLFTDVVMPGGRNGVELARLAREARPELKVLLTSGYVGQALALAGNEFELIDKPYERATLAAKVSELMSEDGEDVPAEGGRRRRAPRRAGSAGAGRQRLTAS